METNLPPIYYTPKKDDSFFRNRHNTTIAFVVGVLLFLLPFAELRCGNMAIMSNSGIGLATGQEWKPAGIGGADSFDKFNTKVKDQDAKKVVSSGLNIFLLIALAVGLFGFGMGLMDPPWKNKASLWAGALACLMMIATMIQLKVQMRSALSDSSKEQIEESMAQLLKIKFTIWFYISLVSFGCAAFFAYKRIKLEKEDKMIPEFDFQRESQPSS